MSAAVCITFILGFIVIEAKNRSVSQYADTRPACPCGSNSSAIDRRVVGGHDSGRGNFPYASCFVKGHRRKVNRNRTVAFCGATLISDSHVITAAHCVKGQAKHVMVDIGDYDFLSNGRHLRQALSITRYPEYKSPKFHTDIALVEFERPLKWENGTRAAWLPPSNLKTPVGTMVSVYGWGRLKYDDGVHPNILQSAELPVVDNKICQKAFMTTIEPNMICAGGVEGHDACIGDSGSGLVIRLGNEYVLCGVVSFGRRCAMKNIPGVYTRVSSFIDWIYKNTMSSHCRPCIYDGSTPPAPNERDRKRLNHVVPSTIDDNITADSVTRSSMDGVSDYYVILSTDRNVTNNYVTSLSTNGKGNATGNYGTPSSTNSKMKLINP